MKLLLKDPRVDPGKNAQDNNPIRIASQKGNVELVRLLMGDKRVDPSALDCKGFRAGKVCV